MSFSPPPTLNLVQPGLRCPRCKSGTVIFRKGPRGLFRGCSTYPSCNWTAPPEDMDFFDVQLFNGPGYVKESRPDDPSDEDVQMLLDLEDSP